MASKRYRYTVELGSPCATEAEQEGKIPVLMQELQAQTCSEAIICLLERHVFGKRPDKLPYPRDLLNARKAGLSDQDCIRLVLEHFGVSTEHEGLIQLASNHVRGFQIADPEKSDGGRPHELSGKSGDYWSHAGNIGWLIEIIDQMIDGSRNSDKPTLTALQCAKRISKSAPDGGSENPFFKVDVDKILNWYEDRKRDQRRFLKEDGRLALELR